MREAIGNAEVRNAGIRNAGFRNAEARRTQSLYTRIFSAISAPLRFKLALFAKRDQAIQANPRRQGYGA